MWACAVASSAVSSCGHPRRVHPFWLSARATPPRGSAYTPDWDKPYCQGLMLKGSWSVMLLFWLIARRWQRALAGLDPPTRGLRRPPRAFCPARYSSPGAHAIGVYACR